jgi:DNA replication ATP-dependent helicase Dna2
MLQADTAATLFDRILEAHQAHPEERRHAIRDLRVLFEGVFLTLTEGERRGFSNVNARAVYIIKTRAVPAEMAGLIHGFRRFANKVTHKDRFRIRAEEYFACLEAIARIVAWFSDTTVPPELEAIYEGKTGGGFAPFRAPAGEHLDRVRCVVTEVGGLHTNEAGHTRVILHATDMDGDLGDFTLSLWQHEHNDLTILQKLIWPYCTLHIHHLRQRNYPERAWTSTPSTQIVLEPDFLIDATDVAECFQSQGISAYLYFLNKLAGSDTGLAAFRGTLINDLLDRTLLDPEASVEEILEEAQATKVLTAVRYGPEAMTETLATIKQDHFPNLRTIAGEMRGRTVRIEPTFVSDTYGLQGRLDGLIEDSRDPGHKEIFELKSGKAPNGEMVWPNHAAQVVCYHLLLRSAFGPARHGLCGVFYSAAKAQPLRDVAANPFMENRVLQTRNRIVRGLWDLAAGDFWLLEQLQPDRIVPLPAYKKVTLAAIHDALQRASPLDKAWYRHYLAFCLRELITAKVGGPGDEDRVGHGFAALWLEQREEKARHFAIMDGLQVIGYDHTCGEIRLKILPEVAHNFREGDIGIIYRDDGLFLHPLQEQILKGSIRSLKSEELVFSLRNRQLDPETFKSGSRWAIEHDMFETNYWVQIQGLMQFLQSPREMRDRLLGLRAPGADDSDIPDDPELGPNQNELLRRALAARDYFLLQGPPGTGKTSTLLMSIVRRTLENSSDKMVLLAFTNRAVLEICEKLRQNRLAFLYLGNNGGEHRDSLQEMVRRQGLEATRNHIAGQRIYVSTVAGFSTRIGDLAALSPLDLVIVDEASQLTEPGLAGLLTRFRKFILIGDQNQLPAVVAQPESGGQISDESMRQVGYRHLSESLFGRMYRKAEIMGWTHAYGMLETHFRMHEEIADLINPYYEGRLQTGTIRQKAPFTVFDPQSEDPWERFLARGRCLFLPGTRLPTAKTNREEAIRVVALLKTIRRVYGDDFGPDTVGVVTPWRAQIVLIRALIDEPVLLDHVLIDTVERFQGLEKKHILASLAIYHPAQLASLHSLDPDGLVDRKLVVTISRAEEQVVLLGHEPALRQSHFYRPLLERMKRPEENMG